jgi:glyoxylase-like metal-dependent hydrolase (beta-lactamase superfamily II)
LKRDKQFFSLRVQFYERLYQEMGCKEAGEQQVEKLRRAMQENEKDKIVAEIIPINESDLVAGLRVIDTPGHSPDHVVFWDEQRKWLFVGDHLISHISSNALVEPDQHGRRLPTLITYIDSLKKCIEIDAEILFPGHGELIYDHRSLISARLNRIEEKAEKLAAHIANGVSTASQLAQIFYKDKYNSQFSLVMSEIIGLIDYLEAQQKIQTELKHGVWCLTAV